MTKQQRVSHDQGNGPEECFVVDAGARYGIHPSWQALERVARFDLYEPEPLEAQRLAQKYANLRNVSVHQLALSDGPGQMRFDLRNHRALSSAFHLTDEAIAEGYRSEQFASIASFVSRADSLDRLYKEIPVHFLKLDVEGGELKILHGATELLSRSVQGVRVEVCFTPLFAGAPLFGDIDAFLRSQGMFLLNLDYDGGGVNKSKFIVGKRYGRLISTDGVWVTPTDKLAELRGGEAGQALLRQALFFLLNGASDYAVDALVTWSAIGGPSTLTESSPFFCSAKRHFALLFKELLYVPQIDQKEVLDTWEQIFEEPFPVLNNFWETLDG